MLVSISSGQVSVLFSFFKQKSYGHALFIFKTPAVTFLLAYTFYPSLSFLFSFPARSRTSFPNRKCSKIKQYLTPTPHNIFEYLPPVFEPGCEDDSEHTKIHEEYKNLVDFMLGSYMEDIGITPDQFESACGKAAIKTTFHQVSFVSMSVGGGRCKIQDVYFLF